VKLGKTRRLTSATNGQPASGAMRSRLTGRIATGPRWSKRTGKGERRRSEHHAARVFWNHEAGLARRTWLAHPSRAPQKPRADVARTRHVEDLERSRSRSSKGGATHGQQQCSRRDLMVTDSQGPSWVQSKMGSASDGSVSMVIARFSLKTAIGLVSPARRSTRGPRSHFHSPSFRDAGRRRRAPGIHSPADGMFRGSAKLRFRARVMTGIPFRHSRLFVEPLNRGGRCSRCPTNVPGTAMHENFPRRTTVLQLAAGMLAIGGEGGQGLSEAGGVIVRVFPPGAGPTSKRARWRAGPLGKYSWSGPFYVENHPGARERGGTIAGRGYGRGKAGRPMARTLPLYQCFLDFIFHAARNLQKPRLGHAGPICGPIGDVGILDGLLMLVDASKCDFLRFGGAEFILRRKSRSPRLRLPPGVGKHLPSRRRDLLPEGPGHFKCSTSPYKRRQTRVAGGALGRQVFRVMFVTGRPSVMGLLRGTGRAWPHASHTTGPQSRHAQFPTFRSWGDESFPDLIRSRILGACLAAGRTPPAIVR